MILLTADIRMRINKQMFSEGRGQYKVNLMNQGILT
jgi:hypothetical protein